MGPLPLEPRNIEVLRLLVQGRPDKQIGAALSLPTDAVRKRIGRMRRRLSVDNRVQLAVWAVKELGL